MSGAHPQPKADLVALVEKLKEGDADEAEGERTLDLLRQSLPHPALSDLIFWPDRVPGFPHSEPTAEQIVEFASAYQPRPFTDRELAGLFDRLIRGGESSTVEGEDLYRLGDTLPDSDWEVAVSWARLKGWSGEEVARRLRSGELERDPEYRTWVAQVFDPDYE
jgi:hypothetical protein